MWLRESLMKEYARKHPGCSLQEYCEYLDNIAREDIKEDFYEIFIDSNTTRISLKKNRIINCQCPLEQEDEKCIVISEELFNTVVSVIKKCILWLRK